VTTVTNAANSRSRFIVHPPHKDAGIDALSVREAKHLTSTLALQLERRKNVHRFMARTARARPRPVAVHTPIWPAVLLVACGLAVFANGLSAPLVFDDHWAIVDNPSIRRLWPPAALLDALTAPRQSAVAGRPVVNLSLAVNYALGGLDPRGYHAFNLAVHLIAALLLFGLVRRTLERPALAARFGASASTLAFAVALIWLAHPLQTEVIDYVSQRTESMSGLFYLLTLYAAVRATTAPAPGPAWYAVAVGACALGMASKESMVTAPLMIVLYDVVFNERRLVAALRERPRFYGGLFSTWIILAALVASGPRSHSAGLSAGVTAWTYLLNQAPMIVAYLKLVFWPRPLVFDYGMPAALALRDVLPQALLLMALLAATVAAWWRSRALAFLGFWFFVTLAPSSSVIPIATEAGAERRMYLPLAAVVVLAVVAARVLLDAALAGLVSARRRRLVTVGLLGATFVALATLTVQRNGEYRDPITLWQTVVDRRPGGRAHYNLGVELKEAGRRDEALDHYRQAAVDNPEAHYALGFELQADGKYEDAIGHLREYVRLQPDDLNIIRAYNLIGRALTVQERWEEASDAFRQALRRQPSNADAHLGLADALAQQDRFDDAISEYEQHLRLRPGNTVAREHLDLVLRARERARAPR
jgi:tetratricopeptide (TPR) repeat protein